MRSKSILVGVLALGLGLLATRGVTGQDKDKKEPETKAKVGEPVKDKATEPGKDKVDEPTVPVKGKLLLFEMRGKPWEQVFEWLADQTGLHYVSEYKAPTGSFTFIAPRTADGKPRLYTVPDVIDIINEALLAKKHTLLRRKTSFTLWPADEKIPPYMIQQVSPEELRSDFGSTEVVQVVKRFKRLVADDIKGEVKRRMGPFGDIAALDAANELWMQDTAGNLRRILADLDRIENDEPLTETFTYRCKNIRASDAERILKDALGEGKTIIESTKGPAAVSTPSPEGKGERPEGKGFFFGKGGDRESSRPTTTTKVRVVHITSDDRTNTVIINAKADKIGQAKAILSEIDVPESPVNRPVLVHYPVSGNADATIKMLSDLYKPGASLRFWATSASTVSVFASPVEQEKISDIIRGPRATTKTEVVGLALLDSTRLAETLIKMFGDTKSGAPYIEADPLRNAIIIKGNPDQVKEVKDAIRAIGENPAAISGSMRIIGLDKGSAATLGTAIEQLFPQMRDNPFKLILPGSGDYIPKKAPAKEEPPVKELKPKLSPIFFEAGDKGPIVDPAKKRKKDLPPVTITAFGSKLIVTSDDKDALALVTELVRLLTTAPGEGDFQLIPLKNANATDAARILDEAFNGKPAPRGGGGRPGGPLGGGLGGLMMSAIGLGGGGGETPAERVRVVADPSINSLLVKANPLDMLTIRALVAKIDSGPSDDAGVGRTHVVGPLKSAAASEVATIIRDVYKQAIDGGPSEARVGGFPGFAFPIGGAAAGGGGAARKAPILAVGVDDKTNSLVVHAPDGLFKDIKTLIDELEKRAEDAQTVVQVVGVKGMDPYVVQQAMDALQGRNTFRRTTTGTGGFGPGGGFNPGGGGFNPGGGFGPGGFNPGGTGVFPGVGVFPRFGGTGFGGTGFGGPGMGGFGTGGPGGGGFRGPGGGGRGPGGRVSMADPPGGRDFFVSRVTDDPERTSILYDPRVERIAAAELNTFSYVSHEEEDVIEPVRSAVFQEAGDKDGKDKGVIFPGKDGLPGKLVAGKGDTIVFPRLPVTIEALPELNIVVIRAANPADLEAALKIIKLIQDKAAGADVEIRIVPLRQADPVSVSVRLNEFYQRVLITPTATSIVSGLRPTTSITLGAGGAAPGGATISSGAAATVATNLVFIPLVRQHALWIAAPKARMDDVMKQVQALDQPTALESKTMPFALKRQPANRVAAMISSFYADRFPTEARTQNIVRVTSDDATNTVFVQASPADMADIKSLIEHIDNTVSPAVSELRVVPLRNAVSDDLASIITRAISDTFFGTTQPGGTGIGGALGLPGGGAPTTATFPGGGGPLGASLGLGTAGGLGTTRQWKVSSLRLIGKDKLAKAIESGVLEDIRITSDPRTNSLIVAAPEKTMALLLSLIKELDTVPNARSEINVFTLKRGDAIQVALSLQQLFLGTGGLGTTAGRTTAGVPGLPGTTPGLGTAAGLGTPRPLTLTLSGLTPEGAPIIDLRLTVDERTNSIIAAGSRNDLDIIEAIINKLEDANSAVRRNFAYKLRNAQAADVAAALNDFETKSLTVYNKNTFLGPFEQLQREVVVTPDPISNTLLINTSPERFDDVVKLIEQLDALPPQVMIQVLLAEVDLNDNQEFGVEIGLQSPVFFNRGNNGGAATSTSTFDTALAGGTAAGSQPGFNFNTTNPLPNLNAAASPGTVGWQGLQNLGVGRLSSASGVGGLVFSAASDSFNLLIRALKVQGRIDILSRPQVMTLDGQAASVAVGQDVPYLSSSSVTGTGVATQNIDRRTVGVLLQVQPKINPDGSVLMRVIPEVSNVNPTPINLGNGILGTVFNVQRIETTVSAWDGETVALGGLITRLSQKNENKVPWVGDLPGVGALFRYRTYQKKKTELIVIMTPHIVRCKADADRILAEESRRVDWILRDVHRLHTSGPAFGLNPDLKTIPLPGTIAPAPRPVPGDTPISALPGSGPPPLAKAGAAPAAATAPAPLSPAAVVPASTLPAAAKGLPAVPEHVIVIPAASPVAPPALTPPAAKVEAPAPGVAPTPVGGPGPVSVIDVPGPTGSTAAYPAGPRFVR